MESLVVVAYIVSITAGFPLAEVTTNTDGKQRETMEERSFHVNSTGKGKSYSTDANATAVTTDNDDILRTGDSSLMTSYVKTYGDATAMTSDQEPESRLRGDDDVTSSSVVRTESGAAAWSEWRLTEDMGREGGPDPSVIISGGTPSSAPLDSAPLTSAQTESKSPRDFTDDLQTADELEQQQRSTTTTTTTTKTTTTTTTTTARTTDETDAREASELTSWAVFENSSPVKEESEEERERSSDDALPSTESQEKEKEKEEEEKEKEEETESRDVPLAFVTTTAYDEATYQRYAAIVEALEELGILSSDGKWCYSMEKITKSSSSSLLWRVELLIRAVPMESSSSPLPPDEISTQLQRLEGTGSDVRPTSGVECLAESTSGVTSPEGVDCVLVPVNATDEEIPVNNGSDSTPEKKKLSSAQLYDNGAMKPSKTQIFVISTCSVVIGLFFVVALIMRIRNHLKRTRTLNKHRGGVRHHRPSSGPRDPASTAALPLATAPPVDANQKPSDGGNEKSKSSSVGRFFDRRWRSSEEKKEGEAKTPMTKKRQGELRRFFISQRSQREAAREYIRQLSLTNPAHPPPPPPALPPPTAEQPPSAVETSPNISSKKLASQPSRSSQKLNIS